MARSRKKGTLRTAEEKAGKHAGAVKSAEKG